MEPLNINYFQKMFGEVLLHIRAKKLYLPYRTQHLQVLQLSIECISELQFVTC